MTCIQEPCPKTHIFPTGYYGINTGSLRDKYGLCKICFFWGRTPKIRVDYGINTGFADFLYFLPQDNHDFDNFMKRKRYAQQSSIVNGSERVGNHVVTWNKVGNDTISMIWTHISHT